ncbi:MAG: CopD family protein [Nitrososphaerales archaeon]
MQLFDTIILWIHLFSAVIFVGGSFFIWLVVMPASHRFAKDESERTQIVGKIAKDFARITNPTLIILVLTGMYNISWYLPSYQDLFTFQTYDEKVLFIKVVLVAILIVLIYAHGLYYGKKIVKLAQERNVEGLKAVRKRSRIISFANLALMVAILVLAAMLQMPP